MKITTNAKSFDHVSTEDAATTLRMDISATAHQPGRATTVQSQLTRVIKARAIITARVPMCLVGDSNVAVTVVGVDSFVQKTLMSARCKYFNPLVTNGLSHPYHLDESIFKFRGVRSNFLFLFHFSMKIMSTNRIAPDGTPRFAASHLGLFCLPMSQKQEARLIWVKKAEYTER